MTSKKSGRQFDLSALSTTAARVLAAEDMRDYAIFSLDADGNVASWNDSAMRLEGYRSDEIIGRHFSAFYPAEQVASGYPQWELAQARANGFLIDRGWRLRADGSRYWAHVVITVQRATDGEITGYVKIIRDESAANARRARCEQRFSDLFDLVPVGIALIDGSGAVLDANNALCELLGYRLPDLQRLDGRMLLHPSDRVPDLLTDPAGRTDAGHEVPHRVLARADGEPVMCELHRSPSVADDGSRSWLVAFHDVTAQVRTAERLRQQATHDELTGLLNRTGVKEVLTGLLRADGPGRAAVLFCDLDNFKRINDELGHEAGDELLAAVAQRLHTGLPDGCTAARLYGDEFLVVCPDVAAHTGLDALVTEVAGLLRITAPVRDRMVRSSACVGGALVRPGVTHPEQPMRAAHAAMLQARLRGPAQVGTATTVALPPTARAVSDQLALEELLRQAIRHDRLQLHYQPIVTDDGSVTLAEALLRWTPDGHPTLTPDVVLRVAEQGGLLADLDRCVLRTALRESAGWPAPAGRPIGISVNLSGLRPDMPGFAAEILAVIDDAGVDPRRVVLEMVETVLADPAWHPSETMAELVEAGIRFAMDDFGTGYSSLARLKDLPTQILKIDQRFVAGLGDDAVDLGIARAVTELARTMGRSCIAEGVENATQHRLLRDLGVHTYQGYLFSTPLPADGFRAFLATPPAPAATPTS